ncbi:hypothetical protein CRI70_25960 [Streptomyces sp. Ru87]|nr:hypothetical protein CRI70_25960 [Streptomyces sp. Ru87]
MTSYLRQYNVLQFSHFLVLRIAARRTDDFLKIHIPDLEGPEGSIRPSTRSAVFCEDFRRNR